MKPVTFAIAMILATFIFLVTSVSIMEPEKVEKPETNVEEIMNYSLYCSMVEQWQKEQQQGIELYKRTGWAPFMGQCE